MRPGVRAALSSAAAVTATANAGWTWVFFRLRRPDLALVRIGALNTANLTLLRQAWNADRGAGAAVAPYVAWTAFATALNTEIVRRNPKAIAR